MVLLLLASGILFAGPLIDRLRRRRAFVGPMLDGFVLTSVCGLVLLEIIPQAWEGAGGWVLPAVLLGLIGPRFLEGSSQWLARQSHSAAVVVAAAGLLVHAGFDGVALADAAGQDGRAPHLEIGLAVVLHRLALSLGIWEIARGRFGRRGGFIVLFGMAIVTALGYFSGRAWLDLPSPMAIALFEGLVAGALLHVLLHNHEARSQPAPGAAGALFGTGLLLALFFLHDHGNDVARAKVAEAFFDLSLQAAPALVIAFTLTFLFQLFIPNCAFAWLGRGSTIAQAFKGLAVGIPLPLCSCGVVPAYRALIDRGVPAVAAMTFLIATPEIGLDAILISIPLLGTDMAFLRIAAALVVALVVGMIVGRLVKNPHAMALADAPKPRSIKRAFHDGVIELFENTAPWILFGLLIAAFAQAFDLGAALAEVPPALRVVAFALAGIPLYICASGATPFVAVLLAQGLSPGAALAFLITGPATNATTFGLLRSLHSRRIALFFVALVFATTVAIGVLVDWLWAEPTVLGAADWKNHDHELLSMIALGILSLLFIFVLFRVGPRALMAQILPWAAGEHSHDHHGHDHGNTSCCAETAAEKTESN